MTILESINGILTELLGPLGPLFVLGGLGLLLIVATFLLMPKQRSDPMARLQEEVQGVQRGKRRERAKSASAQPETLRNTGSGDKLDKFAAFLEPKNEEEMTSARKKMLQAGYRSKNSVRTFHAAQFVLGIGLLTVGLIFALVRSTTGEVSGTAMTLMVLGPGLVGYYLPRYWIERRRQSRQQEILDGFPDSLDMMLVCIEAGQSLDQSILRVAKELRAGYPALSDEFEIVSHEVKAGKDRVIVLKDMAERCGVTDINSFVTVLIQSSTFGTSIADALRVYAAEMRDKRVMRAEEKANTLPTKLTLGTMMLTVPPLLIILIGPSVYGIAQSLGSF